MLGVQLPPGPLTRCPGGPARSGRHALNVEIMGSNPIQGTERRVGWALASPSGCNPPATAVQVRLLPDTLSDGLVAQPAERPPLKRDDVGSSPNGATDSIPGVSSE